MIHVDCRKCKNLNKDKSGCIFGSDSDVAIKKCADSGFRFYQPVNENEGETDMGVVKCEKCGNPISCLMVNEFMRDGTDTEIKYPINQCDDNAVYVDANLSWTGYDLSEDEMIETIACPCCGKFPFNDEEVQVHEVVRIVMFKSEKE